MTDPFYFTKTWQRLREARLQIDHHTCVVPGCGQRATVVDHVVARRAGGADTIGNTRSLCAIHDAQVRQRPDGRRAHGGKLFVKGCDPLGNPIDPNHDWNRKR